jgi:enoyl-CoA hydratase
MTAAVDVAGANGAVRLEVVGHIGVITINRADARNAINGDVAVGIEAAIDRVEDDDDIWVGVLTGTPPVFCAGADLKEIQAGHRDRLRTERGGFAGIVTRNRRKPMIAAVEGSALAGGTEICLACDLIVASTTAKFGIPEVKRGLVAAGGGLFRLPRRLPFATAMELALTGEPIDAARAHSLGMVSRVTETGGALDGALALARLIETNAPGAVQASRRVMIAAAGADDATGWRLSEDAMVDAMAGEERLEGIAAFVEKRKPVWTSATTPLTGHPTIVSS